ncbi:SRPBCC family protein [Streptomyces koelreuteriae]|uniref:SRPBCC family protein n=1 Tax=Streptomyces koelreuteriae TaxID=2838015 RepID=UPI003EBC133F
MIEVSRTLSVNDGTGPVLGVDEVWEGLVDKAQNPLPYVASISECTVTERFDSGLVRDIVHAGQPVREVVTFYPKQRVHFVRTHGSAKGTIDNEIGLSDTGEPELTFTFRIVVDGVEADSPAEKEFAERMEADYLDAVRTTLKAVRDRTAVASGTSE